MKPNIAIIITRSEIGGAQKYVQSLVTELKHKYNFDVIIGTDGYLSSALREQEINVHIIPKIDSLNLFKAIYDLFKILKKINPHVINTHSTLASLYGRVANIRLKIPLIYSVHGWFFADNASFVRKLVGPSIESGLARFTTFWITETKFDLDMGIRFGAIPNSEKAKVIANGIPITTKNKNTALQPNLKHLVFIGRLSYQKNPELAIKILSQLPKDYTLTMYCDNAHNQKIIRLINSLGVKERITLIDSEKNTASIIHLYELLLVTSRYEGMPLSIIEAMNAGLTIICPNVCGLNEIVEDGQNGYLVNGKTAFDFAKQIEHTFKNKEKLNRMKRRSKELYKERHTIEEMVNKISETFDSIIKKKSAKNY